MPGENIALFRRFVEDVLDKAAYERKEEVIAPDFVLHTADLFGPEGYRLNHTRLRAAFPYLHIEIQQMVEEGDMLAFHLVFSGTHLGEYRVRGGAGRTIARIGGKIAYTSTQFRRIANGMFVEG